MNVIIVGCGRVGVELALSLHQNHLVTVIDPKPHSFDRLGLHFSGRTIQGEGLNQDTLQRAEIETAQALAAVTSSDNVNAIVARIARDIYHVGRVVARVYNPRRAPIYDKLGIQTVSSSSWGAHRMEQVLIHPGLQSVGSAGNGEVQLFEMTVPPEWSGRKVTDLLPVEHLVPVTLARGGCGILPRMDTILEADDILQVSATTEGAKILRGLVHENGNGHKKE
ncbi:MAG: TrkA family potassium uptake protein [Chloroflexi bacterium]|nr:TrkA family potassium uptake protein [Chloroflexota bacterium]MBI1854728.1 TrkA family potassium uptake protein [Chloroflexota bacterium]MBI3339018.1 TrkA family potassium uptake protein [Chloroflexota bacterium]